MPPRLRVAILGVGSPFGADRAGWLAVERLAAGDLPARHCACDLRFEQCDRPGSRLLALLQEADAAVIIDAMRAALPAGAVRSFTPEALGADSGLFSSHGFGVAEALALGRQLGGLPSRVTVVGIEIAREEAPEAACAIAETALRQAVEQAIAAAVS